MTGQRTPSGSQPRDRKGIKELLGRAKPAYVTLAFGVVAAVLDYSVNSAHNRVDVLVVALLVMLAALSVELTRDIAVMRRQLSEKAKDHETAAMGRSLSGKARVRPCWNEDDTVSVLRCLDKLAHPMSKVQTVWGALEFTDEFSSFVEAQLGKSLKQGYRVDRWVDISRVPYDTLSRHLTKTKALSAMRNAKYIVHLVPKTPFGAMVVDDHAAINYQVRAGTSDVLGFYGKGRMLASRIEDMISELGGGLELPGNDPKSVTRDHLMEEARKYYEDNGMAA